MIRYPKLQDIEFELDRLNQKAKRLASYPMLFQFQILATWHGLSLNCVYMKSKILNYSYKAWASLALNVGMSLE